MLSFANWNNVSRKSVKPLIVNVVDRITFGMRERGRNREYYIFQPLPILPAQSDAGHGSHHQNTTTQMSVQ